jgi:two-component system, LytTR family, sensor kinase
MKTAFMSHQWITFDFQPVFLNFVLLMVRSRHITLALHVLIWGAVLLLPYFVISPNEHYSRIGSLQCNFFTITNLLHIALFYFNAFLLYSFLMTRHRWPLYLISLAALTFVFYHIKLLILKTWFSALAADEAVFNFTFFPTIFFLVVSTTYRLVLDKMDHEKRQTKTEAEKLNMELRFLRSQVSPHFLFNVLNNLVSMARHRSDLLEPSLIRLSGLMRYMLYESDERKVSIETEVEYLKSYIELQKIRFEDDVQISTDIREPDRAGTIEPMLLIPFVENAFKHGIAMIHKPFIRIALAITGNTLSFHVENKFGDEKQSMDKDHGIGLANIRARLNLLYPQRHKLTIAEDNNIFVVELSLQLN